MPRTYAQNKRQSIRDRSGRYSETNPCEVCNKGVIDYCSDSRVDSVDSAGNSWDGIGLCLCERCCDKLSKLPDNDAYQIVKGGIDAPWLKKKVKT